MKKYFFLIFVTLVSCNSNEKEIDSNFMKVLVDYQNKYPIPKKDNLKKRIYVYIASFSSKGKDTLLTLTRSSSGITEITKGNGIYQKNGLLPTFVADDGNFGKKFLIKIRRDNIENYYWKNETFPESFPPIYSYKIDKKKFNLIRVDTVWNNWD